MQLQTVAHNTFTLRTSDATNGDFRLAEVAAEAEVFLTRINVERFGVTMGNGGALLIRGQASLQVYNSNFRNNLASGNGGAIPNSNSALDLRRCSLLSPCTNVLIENPFGKIKLRGNTLSHPNNGIDSTASARLFGNIFNIGSNTPCLEGASLKKSKQPPSTEAGCNDFGSGAFQSEGYNISTDGSCALNQETDLPNTNPVLTSQNGYLVPQAGSPVIDAGSAELFIDEPGSLASLPCGYVDALGTARPQDGNSDSEFECDMGAIEIPGTGSVTAGHPGTQCRPFRFVF